jgi:peroxiredoxin Q/BCP
VVLGASKDTVKAQKAFADKHGLNYSLLADADGSMIKSYGVNGVMGLADRKTVLIDSKGRVARTYASVNPVTHAKQVSKDLADVP